MSIKCELELKLQISHNYFIFSEPPKISSFTFPDELEVGGSTQASCSLVSGDKPIQFTWLKDNLPIPSQLKVNSNSVRQPSS